ncbi:MAG: hypothetical protein NTY99_00880 [DPANN group archaeon]|nr:hypothetical protein [DPANN group archaeon]
MTSFDKLTADNLEKALGMLDSAQHAYCLHKKRQSDAYLAYGIIFDQTDKAEHEDAKFKELQDVTLCENIAHISHILFRGNKTFFKKYCKGSLYEIRLATGKLQLADVELSGCGTCRGPAFGILYPDKLEHFSIPSEVKYVLDQFARELSVPLGKRTKRCVI